MSMAKQLAELRQLGVMALRTRYAEVFGEETRAGNKAWLLKRIAWRIQAQAEGDLSERARQRAAQLANDADLRLSPPRSPAANASGSAAAGPIEALAASANLDRRLPPPGTLLNRSYKGQSIQVLILDKGFEYEGRVYRSLSAVAKQVTGTHCNGFLFFNLLTKGNKP
jgi:hypothetical protein